MVFFVELDTFLHFLFFVSLLQNLRLQCRALSLRRRLADQIRRPRCDVMTPRPTPIRREQNPCFDTSRDWDFCEHVRPQIYFPSLLLFSWSPGHNNSSHFWPLLHFPLLSVQLLQDETHSPPAPKWLTGRRAYQRFLQRSSSTEFSLTEGLFCAAGI